MLSFAGGLVSAYGCAVGAFSHYVQPRYRKASFATGVRTDSIEQITKWNWPGVCVYSAAVREQWVGGVLPSTPRSLSAARDRVLIAVGTTIDWNGTVRRDRITLTDLQYRMTSARYQRDWPGAYSSPMVVRVEHRRAGWPLHAVECWAYEGSWGGEWSYTEGAVRWPESDPWYQRSPVPVRPIWTGLLGNGAMHASMWLVCFVVAHSIRSCFRRRRDRCVHCSYDLRGLPCGSRCPECGADRAGLQGRAADEPEC